ncbi:uncharacterized protein BO88DRAFT_88926 [Aspergillus vadensis CBS 113365]|uniref:Uncharacterized protein n=1 Tax=Aspergillus vadensis (strain CBS 113365 / IMI 142717 / IBT 24658) TaxID=1448311 RepID=A0A319B3G9_ASPVC|nr:hypothetical protein BO88DRAFT_88926 [Aspergillus vadensis CBS 113365]PYH66845.1 hypothetical protein BO88DRAFT_88926 [Aspergillus vadensis CBS 113365]
MDPSRQSRGHHIFLIPSIFGCLVRQLEICGFDGSLSVGLLQVYKPQVLLPRQWGSDDILYSHRAPVVAKDFFTLRAQLISIPFSSFIP